MLMMTKHGLLPLLAFFLVYQVKKGAGFISRTNPLQAAFLAAATSEGLWLSFSPISLLCSSFEYASALVTWRLACVAYDRPTSIKTPPAVVLSPRLFTVLIYELGFASNLVLTPSETPNQRLGARL